METRSAKRKKLLNQQQFNGGEDRISDLPNVILHQILFLLPIRSIAQTSVLSKRWKSIWYTFPDLDFTTIDVAPTTNSTNPRKRKNFNAIKAMDFVTQVLNLRGKYSDIRVLRLKASLSFSRLNGLIRCAVRHNVQEIDIDVATNDYFNFPRSVINSDTLRVFKLKSRYPGFRLAPNTVMKSGFQSLHTLSLSLIVLYQQPSLLDLFSGNSFPLLRNLKLEACFGLKRLRVSCRGLEDLTIGNCFQLDDLEVSCPKLEKFRVSSCFDAYSCKSFVKIDAPRLKSIVWDYNAVTQKSCVENLSCLNDACVSFFVLQEEMSGDKLWNISSFLCGLSNAKCLTLESQCVEILSKNNHFAGVLQPFINLKSLELHTNFNKQNIPKLASLLKSSPSIHTLIFKTTNNYKAQRRQWNINLWDLSTSGQEQYWESQSEGLKSFLHHLKVVKIIGFSECEDDISLVKFLLKHARVLQEMILCSGKYNFRGSLRREKIKSQMMGFSRASSNAKLIFQ